MRCPTPRRSTANCITERQFRSVCTTTLPTLRWTKSSPGARLQRGEQALQRVEAGRIDVDDLVHLEHDDVGERLRRIEQGLELAHGAEEDRAEELPRPEAPAAGKRAARGRQRERFDARE